LKDVRSHDIEALLDYMYLGEVNVNQNDLSSLLKTAECLRIKGLAVPDEDPTKVRKNSTSSHDDTRRDSPPPKRRRHHSITDTIPPRAASPVPSPPKSATALVKPAQTTPIPPHSITPHSTPNTSNTEQDEPTVVKVEMDDNEEQEDRFRRENNYEGSASNDRDTGGDYGPDLSKAEHEPENYGNASFPGSSLQQSGEVHWDEGDSSSFPPESYSGEVPSSQQAQGASDDDDEDEDADILSVVDSDITRPQALTPTSIGSNMESTSQGSPGEPPLLTPISQARQCQLCLVTLANANLLRRHVEDHHFHIRKYDCIHCGKKFKRKEHRERHERIHTGEKPFACHICTARFTQKEHLKGHIENVHNKHDKERGVIREMTGDQTEKDDIDIEEAEDIDHNTTLTVTSVSTSTVSPLSSPPSLNSLSGLSTLLPTTTATSLLPTVLPTSSLLATTTNSGAPPLLPPVLANDLNMNQFTALYAPVNRKTVNSPNKHMQTITINFN